MTPTPESDSFNEAGWTSNCRDEDDRIRECLDFARKLERERDEARLQLEIETKYKEKCIKCGHGWNPSLVESGWCIFCIQRKTREERDKLRSVCDELAGWLADLTDACDGNFEHLVNACKHALTAYNNLPHVKEKSI